MTARLRRSGLIGFEKVDDSPWAAAMIEGMRRLAAMPAMKSLQEATRAALDVPPGGAILDVGCGPADVLIDLALARPDARCVGVDMSQMMIDAAQAFALEQGALVDLRTGSATSLEFADATFDAVRSERLLQWLDDPYAALSEMKRVLKPGGMLVAIDSDWRTVALDIGDRRLEDLAARALSARPSASIGGRLRGMMLDLGLADVVETSASLLVTQWDPDTTPGPAGFAPPRVVAQAMVEQIGASQQDADALVAALVGSAKRNRLHVSLSIFAVVGRVEG